MISLVFFVGIAILLFLSLFVLARRNPRTAGVSGALVEARQALGALQAGLLPTNLVQRIFAAEDWDYVRSETAKPVRQMFLEERKRIAILWIDQVRSQIRNLRRFHRGAARHYAQLNPRMEMELAFRFSALMAACRALHIVVYLGGPYAAPRMIGAMANAAGRACEISEQSLSFLKSAQLGILSSSSAGPAV